MNQPNELPQPEIKTAHELYTQLGIEQPFKEWVTQQTDFATFKPFLRRLPGGALGKDYKLTYEQYELILKQPKQIAKSAGTHTEPIDTKAPTLRMPKLKTKSGVELANGYYSIEAYIQAVFGEVFPDKKAKNFGIILSAITRRKKYPLRKHYTRFGVE